MGFSFIWKTASTDSSAIGALVDVGSLQPVFWNSFEFSAAEIS
jgi:hypothetical protein